MSMTREEAIEELERLLRHWDDLENGKRCFWGYDKEAVALALSALRPITREQVEKMRGEIVETVEKGRMKRVFSCCGCDFTSLTCWITPKFCPSCGAPMTDEAVDMVMERLEVLRDGKGDC